MPTGIAIRATYPSKTVFDEGILEISTAMSATVPARKPMARPRQHAPEALHAQVMAACDGWLQEQPAHTLSLRALAREVGCAPSTLLKLYGSFGNLLQHVNVETLGRLRGVIEPLLADLAPEQRLKALA